MGEWELHRTEGEHEVDGEKAEMLVDSGTTGDDERGLATVLHARDRKGVVRRDAALEEAIMRWYLLCIMYQRS